MAYKWVSIYFDRRDFERLEKVMVKLKKKGVKLSKYAVLKAWIIRIFNKIESGDASWLEGLEEELEKNKVKASSNP